MPEARQNDSTTTAATRTPGGMWLKGHLDRPFLPLLAALLLAAAVRIAYVVEIADGPLIWQHRLATSDMHFFDVWARQLAGGDWLQRQRLHPATDWMQTVAADAVRRHPERVAEITGLDPALSDAPEMSRRLWDHWYGGDRYHKEPLYPYLMAVTYAALGTNAGWVFAWQMLASAGSVWLLYVITRQLFGSTAAFVAGILAALSGPLVFYDAQLLRASLLTLAGLAIVLAAMRALERPTARRWLGVGLLFGLAMLLKGSFAVFGVFLAPWIIVANRRHPRRIALAAAAGSLGFALAILPGVARNVVIGVPPLAFSSINGVSFICANAEDFRHGVGFFISRHTGDIMIATDGRLLPAAAATWRTHDGLGSIARLVAGKAASLIHRAEIPNNASFHYYRWRSTVLKLLPVTATWLLPLGVVGLVLGLRRAPARSMPLVLLVGSHAAVMLIAIVLSRYRLPMLMALIPFAALALVSMADAIRERRTVIAAGLVVAVALGVLVVARPWTEGPTVIRAVDYLTPMRVWTQPEARAAWEREDWRRVADVLEDALAYEPPVLALVGPERPPRGVERRYAEVFGNAHHNCGTALGRLGDEAAARPHLEAAARLRDALAVDAAP